MRSLLLAGAVAAALFVSAESGQAVYYCGSIQTNWQTYPGNDPDCDGVRSYPPSPAEDVTNTALWSGCAQTVAAEPPVENGALHPWPPDTNDDRSISVGDFGAIISHWGNPGVLPDPWNGRRYWDINGDGGVSVGDLGMITRFWGNNCASIAPSPPVNGTSHYAPASAFQGGSPFAAWGCNQTDRGAVYAALFFFAPEFSGGQYGTRPYGGEFRSIAQIVPKVQEYVGGFALCATGSDFVYVATSTSNWDGLGGLTYAHGQAWGNAVLDLNQWIRDHGYAGRAAVYGGIDAETAWSEPAPAKDWRQGYLSTMSPGGYEYPLLAFNSAAGCPIDGSGDCAACENGCHTWTQSDLKTMTGGSTLTWGVPQIYAEDGYHAAQWKNIGDQTGLKFHGTLSQDGACAGNCAEYESNRPQPAWRQLLVILHGDPSPPYTYPDTLEISTDVTW